MCSVLAWAPAVLSGVILVAFSGPIYVVLTRAGPDDRAMPLVNVLLGSLAAMATEAADEAVQALKAPLAAEAPADARRARVSGAAGWFGRLPTATPQAKAVVELGEKALKGLGWGRAEVNFFPFSIGIAKPRVKREPDASRLTYHAQRGG